MCTYRKTRSIHDVSDKARNLASLQVPLIHWEVPSAWLSTSAAHLRRFSKQFHRSANNRSVAHAVPGRIGAARRIAKTILPLGTGIFCFKKESDIAFAVATIKGLTTSTKT